MNDEARPVSLPIAHHPLSRRTVLGAAALALGGCIARTGTPAAPKPAFLLVHGSFHGGWCWTRLAPLLRAAGHEVLTPDLAGLGADTTPPGEVTLAMWIAQLEALIDTAGAPVILAGHSRGGMLVTALAERRPQAVSAAVWITAMMPRPGESVNDAYERAGTGTSLLDQAPIETVLDGTAIDFGPGADLREIFYNRCSDADVAFALARLRPDPLAPNFDPVSLRPADAVGVPRYYVECLADHALPIAVQRNFHSGMGVRQTYQIDCDHSPFFSAPDELSAALLDIAASVRSPAAGG